VAVASEPEPDEQQQGPTSVPPPVTYGPVCDVPVRHAAMVHWWDELTFLHWRYDPVEVQRLLPEGLTVETFDGSAWVGLVPFYLRVGLPHVPSVPWLSRFCETNVRTYVKSRDGRTGVWFFSLDAARLGAVVVARASYQLPYFWSDMTLEHDPVGDEATNVGDVLAYRSRRRWPGPRGATSEARIRVGEPFSPEELGELDHYLTARWALFSAPFWGLRHARAFHEPWPLHRAEVLDLDDQLVAASGLSQPEGPPLAHWSRSVAVRIGWPDGIDR
jgi:uncharacterized protein YqjF (DUF2071 family)